MGTTPRGPTPSELEEHIASERIKLDSQLNELEGRFKAATDWRAQLQKRPLTFAAASLVGGFAVASMLGNGKSRRNGEPESERMAAHRERNSEQWKLMKAAMVGVGTRWLTNMVSQAVPFFGDEYRRAQRRRRW